MMNTTSKQTLKTTIWIILFALAAVGVNGSVRAESITKVTFPETGYSIDGEFYEYFYSTKDPLVTFGYPISNACTDSTTHLKTQYFQRARLELVEDISGSYIRQTKLGTFFYNKDTGEEAAIPNNSPTCRYFEETGKSVCYLFLSFYDENNGPAFLGLPISNAEIHENGRFVQYFEYARMEWRPEAPDGQHVVLTDLGKIYYDEYASNTLTCLDSEIINDKPLKIQTYAFVSDALIPSNGNQTLYIIVLDQNYKPVEGAMLEAVLHIPDYESQTYRPMDTDENGISRFEFSIDELPVKTVVQIEVDARYQSMRSQTNSWFRIWW